MKTKLLSGSLIWIFAIMLLTSVSPAISLAADLKLEAQLIWATNDKSSDSKLKSVGADVSKKFESMPLKWKYYYVIEKRSMSLGKEEERTEKLSKDCTIKVKNLGGDKIEVQLIGQQKLLGTRTQVLPKGELLLLGGNAENSTAWFIAIKQID